MPAHTTSLKNDGHSHALPRWSWALVPLTALAVLAPMFLRGISCGHDLTFHLTNWFEAAQQWRHGILYPRWMPPANYTAGEPRLIFYPPASWMVGAAIGSITGWTAAPFVYIFVVLCASGAAMYRFARLALWPAAAMAAAILYMANPYMLFAIYTRSAYSEFLAAAIFPLLMLAVLRPRVHVALMAEVVAAVWLTSAPGAVVAMYALLVLAVLSAWRHRSVPNLLRTAAGAALGMGVAALYLLPAAYERKWVQIARVRQVAFDFRNNFLFGHMGEPLHDAVLHQASRMAMVLIGAVAICTITLLVRRRHFHLLQNRVFFILAILTGVGLLMLLPVSALIWQYAPELAYLQFPMRWLLVVAPAFALLLAAVFTDRGGRWQTLALSSVVAAACILQGYRAFNQSCDPEDTPKGMVAGLRSGAGQEGTDEYTPIGADTDDLQLAAPRVWLYTWQPDASNRPSDHVELPIHANITEWGAARKVFSVDLQQPAVAILQVMDYPAWRVHRNGAPAQKEQAASSGQIQIQLPAGHSEIDLRFVHTIDRLVGDAISLFSLLILAWVTWRERHHHHPRIAASAAAAPLS